jgi:hypothetical protein
MRDINFSRSNNYYTSFSGNFVPIVLAETLQITFRVSPAKRIHKKLNPCKCFSPALPQEVFSSLNIALSKISQAYERTTRRTPGGKVYDYVLFRDDAADGVWKPLEILRERLYLPIAPRLEPLAWAPPLASENLDATKELLHHYEQSLDEFRERLNHKYPETSGNNSWQNWIRRNFWLFGANYRQPLPKEKVGFDSIPDFLFVTLDGFLDFLEIKLPQHQVIVTMGKWIESLQAINEHCPSHPQVVSVCDAESDVYSSVKKNVNACKLPALEKKSDAPQ